MQGIFFMGKALAFLITKKLFMIDMINSPTESSQKHQNKPSIPLLIFSKLEGASPVSKWFNEEVGKYAVSNSVSK